LGEKYCQRKREFTTPSPKPTPGAQHIPLDITINDGATIYTNEFYENMNFGLKVVSVHVTDASIYQTITSGVNKLVLTTGSIILTVFKVVLFIEYEYQAR